MSPRFDVIDTPLEGLKLIQRKPINDKRGYFERVFCAEELRPYISTKGIVQINHTLTAKCGTVRGMHFQYPPHTETKFVSCLSGKVFDVAIDMRSDSPTFLQWHAEILSADNYKTLMIPDGFAHGFQAMNNECEMLYFHTCIYQKDAEGGLNPKDPRLAIKWPLPIAELSERDAAHTMLTDDFKGIVL